MKIDNLEVTVPERPNLGHVGGSISFLQSWLSIFRIERGTQVSERGAHLQLLLSSSIFLECFGRRSSTYNIDGPYLGHLKERHGLASYEWGGFGQHGVNQLQMRTSIGIESGMFQLDITGKLSSMQQSKEHWEMPKPLTHFGVSVALPISDAGSVFYGNDAEWQDLVDKQLERIDNV